MKKSPLILMFFCTAFTWSPGAHATDDPWKSESCFQTKNFKTHSLDDGLFDFDDYEATMESWNTADQEAERKINELYTPVDIYYATHQASHLSPVSQPILENIVPLTLNHPDEGDSISQEIIEKSIKTVQLQQIQRDVDEAKEKDIQLHHQIGALIENVEKLPLIVEELTEKVKSLTEIMKERKANEEEAWKAYGPFLNDSDPQIEALEEHEERERQRKAREEEKNKAFITWCQLFNSHAAAEAELKEQEAKLKEQKEKLKEQKEELKKREEEQDAVANQFRALSEKHESLKKELEGKSEDSK